eukprot:CAMPEP_0170538176 /NCGR_PEP_ID=MMETSP0209-20121228/103159_1 /TAXON_ID=665100 ORGANISM="Litonotus pictus, Strain P1" /NCGR_SAMPLE_ID=MMETSP0209 /ASSEMBLY_ACC=CAM_ASM_000301 /LENGTH=580 /DNA_ID=CAMNT_0010839823 /DNA_START=801 /DNA_END=2539 /DNA_ORIENTATION=-
MNSQKEVRHVDYSNNKIEVGEYVGEGLEQEELEFQNKRKSVVRVRGGYNQSTTTNDTFNHKQVSSPHIKKPFINTHAVSNSNGSNNETNKISNSNNNIQNNDLKGAFTNQRLEYQKNIIIDIDPHQLQSRREIYLDPMFLDVLCINCYSCIKCNEIETHTDTCLVVEDYEQPFQIQEEQEDYNSKIFKLYESLKAKREEYYITGEDNLIMTYDKLVSSIYQIFINNYSLEDLNNQIYVLMDIKQNYLNEIESNYKFNLLIYTQRVAQLILIKSEEMEKILTMVNINKNLVDSDSNASLFENEDENEEYEGKYLDKDEDNEETNQDDFDENKVFAGKGKRKSLKERREQRKKGGNSGRSKENKEKETIENDNIDTNEVLQGNSIDYVKTEGEEEDAETERLNNNTPHNADNQGKGELEGIEIEKDEDYKKLKEELKDLDKKTVENKKELEAWKSEAEKLETMLKQPNKKQENYYLSDITSEFEGGKNMLDNEENYSVTSSQYSELNPSNLREKMRSTIDVAGDEILETEEEKKRFFMSIAFKMKFKYSDRIKNTTLKISDIYNEAKEQNIGKEDWYIFIYT